MRERKKKWAGRKTTDDGQEEENEKKSREGCNVFDGLMVLFLHFFALMFDDFFLTIFISSFHFHNTKVFTGCPARPRGELIPLIRTSIKS